MTLFVLLIVPLPFTIRRRMFTFMCAPRIPLPPSLLTTTQKRESIGSEATVWNEDHIHLYFDSLHRQRQSRLQSPSRARRVKQESRRVRVPSLPHHNRDLTSQ
jgi:hypothetical protein